METKERKMAAEWIVAQSLLNELQPKKDGKPDYSKEAWERNKDGFLGGRISWETWDRFYNQEEDKKRQIEQSAHRLLNEAKNEALGVLIEKDCGGRSVSDLCEDVVNLIKDKNVLFYRPNSRQIVEVGKIKNKLDNTESIGFIDIKPKRFITMIEKYGSVGKWITDREYGDKFIVGSLSTEKASIILESHFVEEGLPQIQRIFNTPIPIMYNGELTFPKKGYDERFCSWMNPNCVEMSNTNMSIDDAKKVINEIYCDFCFRDEQSRTNAIASLVTPYVRGMFKVFHSLTPGFFWKGNRPGLGKDYGGAIPDLVVFGTHQEDIPICDGRDTNNEELRKKITTAIRNGRTSMYFPNNKGYINSVIFEKLITDMLWTDRILSQNEEFSGPNELNIGLSGNIPVRYTDDFERRCIFIDQFWAKEDISKRIFKHKDLHNWILKNRPLILSALYSLVKNWITTGKKKGIVDITSFNDWGGVVGGIMEAADYGNPCIKGVQDKILCGDTDSDEMKDLFELCFENYPNQPIIKQQIIDLIKEDGNIFQRFDLVGNRTDQTNFSIKLRSFMDREFNDIYIRIEDENVRTARQKYIFYKKTDKQEQIL